MDLVVCVDTAILHLAGAMGRPVWALLRAESAPFFLADAETAPWYPSVKLWRQPSPGAWEPVLRDVAQALGGATDILTLSEVGLECGAVIEPDRH